MTRELDVHVDGVLAGVTRMSSGGALSFVYDDTYSSGDRPTPLSLSMPIERREHKNKVVLAFLQGLLPDNAQAIGSMATTYGVSGSSPFALLEHVGADVAGALQFVPHGTPASDATGLRSSVRPLTGADVEGLLQSSIEEYRDGTPTRPGEGRFSLAGAQPKIALHLLPDGGWGMPEEATPTTHILKPAAGSFRRFDIVEQMTMAAGRALGLTVAESHLTQFGDVRTFVSRRYDRAQADGVWHRLHQEDLCQAMAVPPAKKYQRHDGGPGVAAVATLIESIPHLDDRRRVARAFFQGFVFNAVVAGTDAHAKNYSLMLEHDRVALAPLYDLATYAPYRRGDEPIYLPMNANGEYRVNAIMSRDLETVGAKLRLRSDDASEIVAQIRSGAVAAFESARAEVEGQGADARKTADEVIAAVATLPLVL